MKSNEERVKSIKEKAKHYKSVRQNIISSVTLTMCMAIAIVTCVSFNGSQKTFNDLNQNVASNSQNNDVKENSNIIVASNKQPEKELPTFESKQELLDLLKEKSKETGRYYYNGVDDFLIMDSAEIAVTQGANKAAPTFENEASFDATATGGYSKTNTQVQGVDEADIVKTNGKNIFYLSRKDNVLHVFDCESEELKELHKIKMPVRMYSSEMFIDDNYIVVIGNGWGLETNEGDLENAKMSYSYKDGGTVLIYDISTFELLRTIEVEGSVISSRKVDDDVYLVTNKYISLYNLDEDNILPVYKDSTTSGEILEVPATEIRYFEDVKEAEDCSYMIVTSFSLKDMESKVNINTFLGAGNEIYCSRENLYVAKINYEYPSLTSRVIGIMIDSVSSEDTSTTSIHKFAIEDGDIKYVATGKVDGRLLNQFSMDEYDGYFRITTTDNASGNNLYVLDREMKQVGCVENLAKGERIYATRFMGDKAYVVTYKTVDPLFVIDLSTPTAPTVLGELKIPGYSSYLHPLGDKYLIGFGEDSVERSYLNWEGKQEVTAYSTGLKLAIFDVSDYNNPKELHSIKIGGRGSYSELLHNHKTLLFNEEDGFIAFPATLTSEAGKYDNGVPMYGETIFNGALVYDISVEDGIDLRGKISHNVDGKFNENIERIIYVGDKLYTISGNKVMSSKIDTAAKIDELEF